MNALRALTLSAALTVAFAHRATAQADTIRARNTRIADSLATLLQTRYVDADTGRMIAEKILAKSRAGGFNAATTTQELGDLLTIELRSVNGDRHLSVRVPPPSAQGQSMATMLGGASAIGEAEILDGNVGYIAFKQMPLPNEEVRAALAAAMTTLSTTDALILDVRNNGGGAGNFNDLAWGYLLSGTDSVPTMRGRPRNGPENQRWVFPVAGAKPRAGIPVYVLANGRTGSAAEGFAFFLQQSGRAKVIGERTAGAGHNVAFFPLPDGMQAGVSIGRVWYPPTMKEWERTGVVPNDSVPSATALCVAHKTAIRALAERAGSNASRYNSVAPPKGC